MTDDERRRQRPKDDDVELGHAPTMAPSELPTAVGGDPDSAVPVRRVLPNQIGRYKILGLLGEGGMGVVYEAEQPEPRRKVALKVIRGGAFVDDARLRLFQREAETLARLKHPNIAAIYESGRTDDGEHFFAMELVQGLTLLDWLHGRPKTITPDELRLRLFLFRQITEAVHYAHQRGVIHRDLKPANVIVSDETASADLSTSAVRAPAIKILDFGLARITEGDMQATMTTEVGAIKGTLPYMSPEQASGRPERIDLRTDVYALGVVLYEMLAGKLPYDVEKGGVPEALRVICEQNPGPLSQTWSGVKRLDPDVETIVGKALEKDADRRYQSAAELAADVDRYLASQPILARPPSTIYQLRKFARRNRVLVGGVLATMLALAIGIVVATYGMFQARAEARRAQASQLLALGQTKLEIGDDATAAFAHYVASLERDDNERVRESLMRVLWRGPTAIVAAVDLPYDDDTSPNQVFSPDGRWLATGHFPILEGQPTPGLRLWPRDGGPSRTTDNDQGTPFWMEFTPDSEQLVTAHLGNLSKRIWNVADGSPVGHIESNLWNPQTTVDDRILVGRETGDGQHLLQSWTLEGGDPIDVARFELPEKSYFVDPTGTWIIFSAQDASSVFVVPVDGAASVLPRKIASHDAAIVFWRPDQTGKRLASVDETGEVRLWSLDSPSETPLRTLNGPEGPSGLAFDTTGNRLLVMNRDGGSFLWDLAGPPDADPLPLKSGEWSSPYLFNLGSFDASGKWAVTGHGQRGVVLWPLARRYPYVLRGHKFHVGGVEFTPDGKYLLSSAKDGTVREWPLTPEAGLAHRIVATLGRAGMGGLAVGPGGNRLAVETLGFLVDRETGETKQVTGDERMYRRAAVGPRGKLVALAPLHPGEGEMGVRIVDFESGETVHILDAGEQDHINYPSRYLEFLPDGRLLVASHEGLRLWNVEEQTYEVITDRQLHDFDVSDDGRRLLAAEEDEGLYFHDFDTGEGWSLPSHSGGWWVALDPTGTIAVSTNGDGVLRVGPVTGEEPHLLVGPPEGGRVTVSPDGRWIASIHGSTILLWPMPEGEPLNALPHDELMERLKSLTNLRIVEDPEAPDGFREELLPFPGWATVPTW